MIICSVHADESEGASCSGTYKFCDSTAAPRRDLAVNVAVPFKVDAVVYRIRLTLQRIALVSVHCLHVRSYYFYLNGWSMQNVSVSNSPSK
jgi:hypothetical protein